MCEHFNALMRITWKPRNSKKTANGGSNHTSNSKRHFQGTCNEEGRASVLHLIQGSKVRDKKYNEEVKKVEQCHL